MESSENNENRFSKLTARINGMWSSFLEFVKVQFYEGEDGHGPSMVMQLLLSVFVIVSILFIVKMIQLIVRRIRSNHTASPYIVKTVKDASIVLRVPQDPNDNQSTPLRRSINENGIEFTYVLWIYINDFNYRQGEWKHVFHKGNANSWPNRTPGVWLHPTKNSMRVYMNTYKNITDFVDIDDLPLNKWFHVALVNRDEALDIYFNGYLKNHFVLSGVCKQNFGDLWVNMNGGFNGYISRMQYFDYAIPYGKIENLIRQGPSFNIPFTAIQKPPYYDYTWWIKK